MQPRVTVALATVWLTVVVLVGGAATLHLSHDQYSPASPRRHAGVQRDYAGDWRDHDPAEDQPFDLWINSRRSISTEEALPRNAKFTERNFPLEGLLKDTVSSKQIYPFSGWQRQLPNIAGAEFAADKVDYGYEMPETLSRKVVVSPSDLLDDPFVADDTFQDQGPGSMEIYKLDLSKEKSLLTATTPSTNLLSRNKSKAPKKTGHLNSKTKTTEIKSITTNANVNHRQSNFFEEHRTETPLINRDTFDVGGVPELQVGCEGLEASSLSHKTKRSIDTPDMEKGEVPASVLLNVSPVSLDLDDILSYDEEEYEMDELVKLKRMETTTKRNKSNRGDMDASHLNSDHLDEFRRPEKLPVRGDLGGSTPTNSSGFVSGQKTKRFLTDLEIKNYKETKPKRETVSLDDDDGASRSHGRQLLWFAEANTEGFADGNSERKPTRRSIDWGFGENEGVVSSDELQTVNERRRQHEMRYHQDTSKKREHHELNTDIDSIRQEYEKSLEQKRREEEEHLRRMQQANRRTLNKWEEEEKRRRDEMRRRQYEEYYKRMDTSTPRTDNEEMRRQMEEQRRQEAARNRMQEIAKRHEEELRRREEERRRWQEEVRRTPQSKWQEENLKNSGPKTSISDEERKRRLYNEDVKRQEEEWRRRLEEKARRQEQYRSQQEAQRKREEEERRRQDPMRNLSKDDRRRLEDHRDEWSEKRRQEAEDERTRQQPSNLMRAERPVSHPNDIRHHDQDEERRQQEERQREQKLREYITRNRPINVDHVDRRPEKERQRHRLEERRDPRMNVSRNDEEYRRRVEEQRKRQEEERKLQDYIRRNQPVNVPSRDNQSTAVGRNWFEERRLIEEARRRDRYPDPGVRREHGPSAPTYIDPRTSPEEVRRRQQEMARMWEEERRQRYEAEERRKELARRQWEEKEERRKHEERMRKEAAWREEEARREQSRRYEEERKRLEVERIQAERRRQEMLKQRSRNGVGRTKQPQVTKPIYYQNPHLLAEHRRRQDSRPIPSNLMRAEEARRAAERERQRLEAERRQQEESRTKEYRQKQTDQWRRQELARLNSLPVSARIIVRPSDSSPTSPVSPSVISRDGFNNEIDFTGINPHREGVQVAQFPAPPTPRPPAQTPGPCVWAVVHCCSSANNRLVKCFESLGCPGINWDPNPCRGPIADAARAEILKFYSNQA